MGLLKKKLWIFLIMPLIVHQGGCDTSDEKSGLVDLANSQTEESLPFHPGLGVGVNERRMQTYQRCVTKADSIVPLTFQGRDYQETSIRSRQQLNEVLSLDLPSAASELWGEASGSVSNFNSLEMVDENFYWLVYAKHDLSLSQIDVGNPEFSLTEDAKKLLRDQGLERFHRACGTEFYSGQRLGARYGLLYEFMAHDEKLVDRLKEMGTYGGFGVKAAAEFEHIISLAVKSNSLKVHSYIEGGDDKVSEYAMNPSDLQREFVQLRGDLFRDGHGIVVESTIQSYDIFGEIQAAQKELKIEKEFPDLGRRTALVEYYTLYMQNRDRVGEIRALLSPARGEDPLVAYSVMQRTAMENGMRRLNEQNNVIGKKAKKCLDNQAQSCNLDGIEFIQTVTIEPEHNFTSMGPWHAELVRSASNLDLVLTHAITNERREMHMDNGIALYWGMLGVTLMAGEEFERMGLNSDGPAGQYGLGTMNQVFDPVTYTRRPDICIYNNAHRCHMRVVPLSPRGFGLNDGAVKIQLTLYDKQGIPLPRSIEFTQKNVDGKAL